MARVFTAKEICERALRAIGAFPLSESAPDGEQMREALFWLDLVMSELAGTTRLFHLIPETIPLTLTPGQNKYPLKASLGESYPIDGVQFPVAVYLQQSWGGRTELTILARESFQSLTSTASFGTPQAVYIDRQDVPTLWTYPTLQTDAASTFTLLLDVQKYTPNVAPTGVTGANLAGGALHGFRQAWQMCLIERLSQKLASGPIFKLSEQSVARFEKQADKAQRALEAFENREHDTEPPIVRAYDSYSPALVRLRGGSGGAGSGSGSGGSGGPGDGLLDADGYYITLE